MRRGRHVAHMGRGTLYTSIYGGNMKARYHVEGIGVHCRVRLKLIFET